MTDLRQAAQQALEALGSGNPYHQQLAATVLRTALEQQAEPPPEWPLIKNILAVFGLDAISFVAKWQAAQQQAEPVAWDVFELRLYGAPQEKQHRVLWVDRYTQPDGSTPDLDGLLEAAKTEGGIDGGAKTLHVRPLYAAPPQQQAEPPPEGLLIKNILDEYGLQAIDFVAEFKAAQQVATIWKQPKQQAPFSPEVINTTQTAWKMGYEAAKAEQQAEPVCPKCKAAVLYECVACSSNNYPPKQQQAEPPQRQWVGLEIEEVQDSYNSDYQAQTRAVEKLLKERNA